MSPGLLLLAGWRLKGCRGTQQPPRRLPKPLTARGPRLSGSVRAHLSLFVKPISAQPRPTLSLHRVPLWRGVAGLLSPPRPPSSRSAIQAPHVPDPTGAEAHICLPTPWCFCLFSERRPEQAIPRRCHRHRQSSARPLQVTLAAPQRGGQGPCSATPGATQEGCEQSPCGCPRPVPGEGN